VLDNCEHVVAACAHLVAGVLSANPAASVLATSREPLGVPGEHTWRVPSLQAPSRAEATTSVAAVSEFDAVQLFVDRARRGNPQFCLDETNVVAIAQICERLDGIPLALELAASRCRHMTAHHIAAALDDRFSLLTGGARTAIARQQTLRASLEWSHDLLDYGERIVFRRLAVFSAPFSLSSVEAVVSSFGDVDGADVVDVLSRLIDKSLVGTSEGVDGGMRYRLPESIREYAVEMARNADELVRLRNAYARWLVEWLEPLSVMPTDAIELVNEAHDAIVAALDSLTGDIETGLRLLVATGRAWQSLGRGGAALASVDAILLADGADRYGSLWARAAITMAILYAQSGRLAEFLELLTRVETVGTAAHDEYVVATARWLLSGQNHDTSIVLRDRAIEYGMPWGESLASTAIARSLLDDPNAAATPMAHAVALAETSGNQYLRHVAYLNSALLDAVTGDLTNARAKAQRIMAGRSPALSGYGAALLGSLGLLMRDKGALERVAVAVARAHRIAPEMAAAPDQAEHQMALLVDDARGVVDSWLISGKSAPSRPTIVEYYSPELWMMARDALDAGAVDLVLERIGAARDTPVGRAIQSAIRGAATGDAHHWHAALDAAAAHGLRLIAADALEGLAVDASRSSRHGHTLRLLAAAERLRTETGYQWRFRYEQDRIDHARATSTTALDKDSVTEIAAGNEMHWHDAVTYAQQHH
jgi:predicted ATPase